MSFTSNTRVRDIAVENPGAKRVLEDAGVDYCCGGEKSLHEACMHAGVSANEILKRLQENRKEAGPEEANWASARLKDLARHIMHTHVHLENNILFPRAVELEAEVL